MGTGRELRIVVFLDGRPGHEKQTLGIIHALQRKITVRCTEIRIKKATLLDRLLQSLLLFVPLSWLPVVISSKENSNTYKELAGDADLLIGTGSSTHLPLLLYKKKFGLPACTCMTPPTYFRKRFNICFVPEHDGLGEGGNIMVTAGAPNCSVNKKSHKEDCGLILLGGIDTASHHWDTSQVIDMVEQVVQKAKDKVWTISSSPRTPQETVILVKNLTAKHQNVMFFDYKDTPAGWVEEQYDINQEVWVTADSISMVYEALSAGCRVGIFPMQWVKKTGKFKRNEDTLVSQNMVIDFSSWQAGDTDLWRTYDINEAARCADRLLQLVSI